TCSAAGGWAGRPDEASTRMRRAPGAVVVAAALLVLAACGSTQPTSSSGSGAGAAEPTSSAGPVTGTPRATPAADRPLRPGERRVTVRMPSAYTPSAPTGVGTDDYRCFLLDPKVAKDAFITGFNIRPGNPDVVHHVILFRVPPDLVAEAERKDAATPGQGWTC